MALEAEGCGLRRWLNFTFQNFVCDLNDSREEVTGIKLHRMNPMMKSSIAHRARTTLDSIRTT